MRHRERNVLPLPDLYDARHRLVDSNKISLFGNTPRLVPYASADQLYINALFGRDSLQIGRDVLKKSQRMKDPITHDPASLMIAGRKHTPEEAAEYFQQLSHDICLTLAELQGTAYNEVTGEEPGKIHHEYRNSALVKQALKTKKISQSGYRRQLDIIEGMKDRFGGKDTPDGEIEILTYYSVDATPLFLKLTYEYMDTLTKKQRGQFLSETFINKNGEKKTMRDALEAATTWLTDTLEHGPLYYYEKTGQQLPADHPYLLYWQYTNGDNSPHQQVLEDSQESWYHPNGDLTNEEAPRIPTEVQGVVYDVLKKGAVYLHRPELKQKAQRVQQDALKYLWIDDKTQYFSQGMDINLQTGQFQQVKTLTISAAELLDSDLLTDLPTSSQKKYISGIARMIYSDEFMTQFGLRTQAKSNMHIFMIDGLQFSPYHSAETSWPVLTGRIIRGFEHVDMERVANDLRTRLMNGFILMSSYVEFIAISKDGAIGNSAITPSQPEYTPDPWKFAIEQQEDIPSINTTNYPEQIQGWSYSAADLTIEHLRRRIPLEERINGAGWKRQVEREVLQSKFTYRGRNEVKLLNIVAKATNERRSVRTTKVDTITGRRLQHDFFHNTWHIASPMQMTEDGLSPIDALPAA